MKSSDVRLKFLQFFEKNGHKVVPSSRLIPDGDPTILFTNAGMNQFKNVFLGLEKRDYTRAVTSQKCLRAGGKHNDLENVGFTARHHTFFEMLGNFSFGDYFKSEAIRLAWKFLTQELGLPKDRLYVSVFTTDDEAADIWHKQEGVAKDRIYRFGEKDNFWRMGSSGPCGPCSEIFYDMGPDVDGDPKENVMGGSGDRYIEIWNNVFMQFNEIEGGQQTPLPKPSVDTGMGLERLTTVLQGKLSNYENDLFQDLIQVAALKAKKEYVFNLKNLKDSTRASAESNNVALRVLADHARASAFLLADGVLPSNDGRGYVLRRIMRRAIRYGRNLSPHESLLPAVVEKVIETMSEAYPELEKQKTAIVNYTQDEEKRFLQTLDQGTYILNQEIDKIISRGGHVLDGAVAFKLYDTYGFPLDLTQLVAREKNVKVDEVGFQKKFEEAREIARGSWKAKSYSTEQSHLIALTQKLVSQFGETTFTGYNHQLSGQGRILALSNGQSMVTHLKKDETGLVICDTTPFYAESGGQVGDIGLIQTSRSQLEVLDCTKVNGVHLHHVRVTDGEVSVDESVQYHVSSHHRRNTANNHSATHLLHSALRKVLGPHITQAGSLVAPDKLRFDFTHNKPLSSEEIEAIENLVNEEINLSRQVETTVMTPDEAIQAGALALFGEKYGEKVRVLKMGDFSMELCGGTHVDNTGLIRFFKIVSENGVSSGVRRIEALTGEAAIQWAQKHIRENRQARLAAGWQESWMQFLASSQSAADIIENLKNEKKALFKQLQKVQAAQIDIEGLIKNAEKRRMSSGLEATIVICELPFSEREMLSEMSDKILSRLSAGVAFVLGASSDDNADNYPLLVSVTKNLTKDIQAGTLLKSLAEKLEGKGGGRPDFAQGAIKKRASFITTAKETIGL